MIGLLDDCRLAVRRLRHQPGFTAVAVLTLALGIGANTAIFTLVHALMLQTLPVVRPAELYRLGDDGNCCVNSGLQTTYSLFSYPLYVDLRDHATELSSLAAFQAVTSTMAVRAEGSATGASLPAEFVSANYFSTFGVQPAIGRLLEEADDRAGAAPVFVLSYRAWTEHFARDPAVIGTTVMVGGAPMTLVGVSAEAFFGDTVRPDPAGVWIPLGHEPALSGAGSLLTRPDQDWLYAIGRLAPGATPGGAEAHISTELRRWLSTQSFIPAATRGEIARQHVIVAPAAGGVQTMRLNFGPSLFVLFAMSGMVLLIASANLANLLLARANRGEAALRAALGASVARQIRQALVEGVVLALAGGVAALGVASAVTHAIVALVFPAAGSVPLDLEVSGTVLAFAFGLAIATGVIFTAAPAWASARANPIDALRGLGRGGVERAFIPRQSLVVLQVAVSLVLLTGAGLLGRSLQQLQQQPLGFDVDQRFVVYLNTPSTIESADRLQSMYERMTSNLESIPGVRRVSYSLYSPMEGNNWSSEISIEGRASDANRPDGSSWNRIGPGYFETMGTRLVSGRTIKDTDKPGTERVAVVNQAFVRQFMKDSSPLGRHLGIGDRAHANDFAIVGVVEDVKYSTANKAVRPMIFLPAFQSVEYADPSDANVQARSLSLKTVEMQLATGASANLEPLVRAALARVDPNLTVVRVRTMADQVSLNFRLNRLMSWLTTAYGLLALALASLGLYGVTAYGVARRRREIGVRLALGANPSRVVRDVLRGALTQTVVGLAIGIPAAMLAANTLGAMLYGVAPRDPAILGFAAAALLMSAALAAAGPARRAAAVNPTEALRAE